MAINYTRMAALADRLIGDHGRPVTLRQSSATLADVTKPWRGSIAPATEDSPGVEVVAIGLFVNPSDRDDWGHIERNDNGTLLKRGEKHCIVAETELNPLTDVSRFETLRDDNNNQVWNILDVIILEPGPTRIMYSFTLGQ